MKLALLTIAMYISAIVQAQAAILETLYDFPTNSSPYAGLVLGYDGAFYGTTARGGSNHFGTAFRITPAKEMTNLLNFTGTNGSCPGSHPYGDLVQASNSALYGTTYYGGGSDLGTVFSVTTNGVFRLRYSFYNSGAFYGCRPYSGLMVGSEGNLYGTTDDGSSGGEIHPCGWPGINIIGGSRAPTVFRLNTTGSLNYLCLFSATSYVRGALVQGADGALYGSTATSGDWGMNGWSGTGSVIRATTNVYNQPCYSGQPWFIFPVTNLYSHPSAAPSGGLVLGNDGAFYGTSVYGGISNCGTIFRFTTNNDLTTLASFRSTNGANPYCGLLLSRDGAFYGTTTKGGSWGYGTVFRLTTNNSIVVLASLNYTNGANPYGKVIFGNDRALYGTATHGGRNGGGTVFKVNLASQVESINLTDTNVQIRFAGFANNSYQLMRANDLGSIWTAQETTATDQFGTGTFTNSSIPLGSAFYRIVGPNNW
jgi:uncharacterized repeat protein (TIGR03803 family)